MRTDDASSGAAVPLPLRLLLASGLLIVAVLALRGMRDEARDRVFEIDEAEWVSASIHAFQLVRTGESRDASAPRDPGGNAARNPWRIGIESTTFGWMNPLVPKLVLGGVAHAGGHRVADRNVFQRFHQSDARLRDAAAARLGPALAGARWVMAALAALVALQLASVATRLAGPVAGAVAYALWLAVPITRDVAHYVRTDLFFLVLALGALHLALATRDAVAGLRGVRSQWLAAAALGALAGIAVGSKLNGAMVSFCVALWIPLLGGTADREQRTPLARGAVPAALLAGALSIGLFWLCSPGLWNQAPTRAVPELLERWGALVRSQQDNPSLRVDTARTLGEHVALAWKGCTSTHEPLRALTGAPGGIALALAGFGLLVRDAGSSARTATARRAALVACAWLAVTVVATTLWLPIEWDRYFLPFVPCMILTEAVLVGRLVGALRRGDPRTG